MLLAFLGACFVAPTADDTDAADVDLDLALCAELNAHRASRGLPAVPVAAELMTVARYHVEDLAADGARGSSCNLHSWTNGDPRWTGCCYTADNAQAACMWNKPREIASYDAPGVEIAAHSHSGRIAPGVAVASWADSEPHRIVIENDESFAAATWRAMGCAIHDGYATAWFGELAAP